jgi:hypothetical protein
LTTERRRRERVRRRRRLRVQRGALLVLVAAVAVPAVSFLVDRGLGARPALSPHVTTGESSGEAATKRGDFKRSLEGAVRRAAALGGSVEVAVMPVTSRRPIVATSPRGGSARWMRMWSMSKVAVMVALLRAEGWGHIRGNRLSPEVASALRGTILRSENCRERRVVLELQAATGGPQGARRAINEVMHGAEAGVRVSREVASPDPSCVEYLGGQREVRRPLAPAGLLGTSTWRVGDAVRLLAALGRDAYGVAVSRRVIAAMRAPKQASREVPAGELTAPLDWGAGRAFANLHPAYKAGWGGTQHGNFMAGQIALVEAPAWGRVAMAVMFHPSVQPPSDDPGRTVAPRAVELVMDSVARAFEGPRVQQGSPKRVESGEAGSHPAGD